MSVDIEDWRPVVGYGGHYEVSSHGRVRRGARILVQHRNHKGYLRVCLSHGGLTRMRMVHRLVASAFIDGTGETVNHKDADKQNNRPFNLEWLSALDNIKHAFAVGVANPRMRPASVLGVSKDGRGIYLRTVYLGRKFGFCPTQISAVAKGKRQHHKGWTWSYA